MSRPCSTFLSGRITARTSLLPVFAARAKGRICSSSATALESTRALPSADRSTLKIVCMLSPLADFGRSIGMPCCTMIFAVTMKMTSRTSMTSTSGVTLMPLISPSSSSAEPAAILGYLVACALHRSLGRGALGRQMS